MAAPGHEFVGVVEAVGDGAAKGGSTVGSFMIPCGAGRERRHFTCCPDQRVFGYGSFLGDVEGAQQASTYVLVPNADLVLHHLDDLDEQHADLHRDIFTTGFDCATEARIEPGDKRRCVVGRGPSD